MCSDSNELPEESIADKALENTVEAGVPAWRGVDDVIDCDVIDSLRGGGGVSVSYINSIYNY